MSYPTRILFVSDEVAPFSKISETAEIVRLLPEQLQETGNYEIRIMMPRYGTISERRNRLHEVIRLSGTKVKMGGQVEVLKVKVASIPGIRLQVYFMDSNCYFKRKGVYQDKQGTLFDDNLDRALFFGRASLETINKLGWQPDIVHAFGWMSSFVPLLLRTEYGNNPLFENTGVFYTPNTIDLEDCMSYELLDLYDLSATGDICGKTLPTIGNTFADATIFPALMEPTCIDFFKFDEDLTLLHTYAKQIYEQVLNEVPV